MPTKFAMRLLAGTAVSALLTGASIAAEAQARPFDIPQQDAATALQAFAMQSGRQVLFPYEAAKGKTAPAVKGDYSDEEVVALLAASAGLKVTADDGRTVTLRPQFAQAADAGGGSEVEALIVTAQKREEDIQDVPIAISAFTQEDLTRSQVAGGPDLMTQVPNMTFTKTNFSSYSIQIRGIGTQAISATTDPAVAVAFNNTPFVRNHFFEQEFYDLQRVEVLRGPQGTLYGRNATAGVVNVISAKPKFYYEAKLSGDVANYNSTRLEGMVNIPLVEDKAALRIAGAWTKRDGFVTNLLTGQQTDGRDLWSGRISLAIEPTDWLRADLIYEHFEENDDRLRTGKQLCHKDNGPADILGVPVPTGSASAIGFGVNYLSQGCLPASLYSPDSFQTPNGYSLSYYGPAGQIGTPVKLDLDPYASETQSRDLRAIETHLTPDYEASMDLVELQLQIDLNPGLTLTSETAFARDYIFSFSDFNRFDTTPDVFFPHGGNDPNLVDDNGVLCDPQLGCTNRLAAGDLSAARSQQISQEFRIASDFDGPLNFGIGANYLRYDTEDKYYVFINSIMALAANETVGALRPNRQESWNPGVTDGIGCFFGPPGTQPGIGMGVSDPNTTYRVGCSYIDPNDIHNLNDQGRNYFLSRNPYHLRSYSAFGELYYNLRENLKLTAGFRWTVDQKTAPQIPSWLIAGFSYGTPDRKVIRQEWREPTGRVAIDWKPDLSFTDETLIYGSYVRGYKAGGANPPPPIIVIAPGVSGQPADEIFATSLTHPETFDPEFVDAFEIGSKNTLLDGRLTANLSAFYYDYQGYQISQIVDRSAVNLNFDAEVWGAELEIDWRPVENFRLGFKGGYESTRMADGSAAIDLMDRTAGHTDWVLVKPFPPGSSNCILPDWFVALSIGSTMTGSCWTYMTGLDPLTGLPYVPNPEYRAGVVGGVPTPILIADNPVVGGINLIGYPGFDFTSAPNNGEGFAKDLSGNDLPNAPHFTATITADYTLPLASAWLMTLHTDLYYQSEAWTRVFNTEGYDKLKAYTNINLAAILTNEDAGWTVMAYVKNVMDRDSITGAFLNSDDTGLTTNVFLTEPRLYGLRVTKAWTGGSAPGGLFGPPRADGRYPFRVELSGGASLIDGDNETVTPEWTDDFYPSAGFPFQAQHEGLDRRDIREIRFTYAPDAAAGWRFSLSGRSAGSEGGGNGYAEEVSPGGCAVVFGTQICVPGPLNWGRATAHNREDYNLADFMVGKDVGLGSWGADGRSVLAAGVRYAEFESDGAFDMLGQPFQYIPPVFTLFQPFTESDFITRVQATRDFSGVGPQVSWEAAGALWRGEAGRIDLDWSVTGGVLFGRQKVSLTEQTREDYYIGSILNANQSHEKTETEFSRSESKSVQVPHIGGTLGLSYSLDRLTVGAGYRWERYFDVIDGGYRERQAYDRTIDGPYFKLSVGFGG